MTHKELCEKAARWLKGTLNCNPVISELVTANNSGEIADAVGWVSVHCIAVEVKVSRADFLRDRNKVFRRECPHLGVGGWRFYLTLPGIVKNECELPEGWGVYEISENGRIEHRFGAKYANAAQPPLESNLRAEVALLRSHIRRIGETK